MKILFLGANGLDTSRLRIPAELRDVQDELERARDRQRIEVRAELAVRPVDLSRLLLDYQPEIVHFSGHGLELRTLPGVRSAREFAPSDEPIAGGAEGAILFERDDGRATPVPPDALAGLFGILGSQRCVVLNACFSAEQAKAIAKHVDHVIGMKRAIGDPSAIAFSIGFYRALARGMSVREAFELGKNTIGLCGLPDADVPELYCREGSGSEPPRVEARPPMVEKPVASPVTGSAALEEPRKQDARREGTGVKPPRVGVTLPPTNQTDAPFPVWIRAAPAQSGTGPERPRVVASPPMGEKPVALPVGGNAALEGFRKQDASSKGIGLAQPRVVIVPPMAQKPADSSVGASAAPERPRKRNALAWQIPLFFFASVVAVFAVNTIATIWVEGPSEPRTDAELDASINVDPWSSSTGAAPLASARIPPSHPPPVISSRDGGTDAGTRDGGTDAGTRDGGITAGNRDGGIGLRIPGQSR